MIDAVFVPRGAEEHAVRRGLGRRGAAIAVYPTRMGASSAVAVEDALASGHPPQRVLVAGLCGSLAPGLVPGDVLLYASIQGEDGTIATDPTLTLALATALIGAQSGIRGLTIDRIATRAADKRALAELSGAHAVDMESYALVRRLHDAGATVAVLRVVSDGLGDDIPDLNAALVDGALEGRALALAMAARPLRAMRLVAGATRGLRALRRSARAIAKASR